MAHKFNRCVLISNSSSTNQKRAAYLAKELKEYFDESQFEVIEISNDQAVIDQQIGRLIKTLDAKTLICIGGGDGTVSMFVNKLLRERDLPFKARKAVTLPLWGGNANDLAYMINGSAYTADIKQIMTRGKVIGVHPLEVSIKNEAEKVRLAINYVSFGLSAYAAKKVDDLPHRRSWLRPLREVITVLTAAITAKPFSADIDGKQTVLYDLVLINGSRIAKVYRAPSRLTDRAFFELTVERRHPLFLLYLIRIVRALTLRRNRREKHNLKIHGPTWVQFDGEVMQLEAGSEIEIKPFAQPFYVLSTKIRP